MQKKICREETSQAKTYMKTDSVESLSFSSLGTNVNLNTEISKEVTNFPEEQFIKDKRLHHEEQLIGPREEVNNEEEIDLEEEITQEEEISEGEEKPPGSQTVEETLGSKIREFLPNWMLEYQIPHVAVNALLKNLISCGVLLLPKDSRTLIGTPKTVHIEN